MLRYSLKKVEEMSQLGNVKKNLRGVEKIFIPQKNWVSVTSIQDNWFIEAHQLVDEVHQQIFNELSGIVREPEPADLTNHAQLKSLWKTKKF